MENEKEYIKCNGCNCFREEKEEYENYKGNRRKTCIICKENRVKLKCTHGKPKERCVDCSGSQMCIYMSRKSECKECGGSEICIHKKRRRRCIECNGSQICVHNKNKGNCRECGGSAFCIHSKYKSTCRECSGSSFCIHTKRKSTCKECSPQLVMINLVRQQVYRTFKNSNLKKINHSIEYLGCDTDTLKEHIDHIKPVSRFNLDDEEELLKCCHFTNLQPLLCKDNL